MRYDSPAQFIDLIGEIPLKAFLAALFISVLLSPLACSDDESGGSSAALSAGEAFSAFRELLVYEPVTECMLRGEFRNQSCVCPGGGTLQASYDPTSTPPTGEILRIVGNCQVPNASDPSDPSKNITFTGGIEQERGGPTSDLCANNFASGPCPVLTLGNAPAPVPVYFDIRFNMAPGGNCQGFSGRFIQTDPDTCSGYLEVSCGEDYSRCSVPADCSEITPADCS
ncbi:hypothetical protein MK280_19990 [Myxococcota bacterium]|nr:hypothetical protein [Myxococcota bacterium]